MSQSSATHPSPERVAAYQRGALPPAEAAEVGEHLASCASCRAASKTSESETLVPSAGQQNSGGARLGGESAPTLAARHPQAPATTDVLVILAGHPRYRVLKLVGSGGMGSVYKAEHRIMERLVALKVVNPGLLEDGGALDRFRQEVRTAARLTHANIVIAYDAEQVGNLHFLVMEFVEGTSLAELVQKKGPMAVPRACECIRQAALGLQHAFEKGMVHRDIKPQNLMMSTEGRIKILDFGLARFVSEAAGSARLTLHGGGQAGGLTAAGVIMGTPDYIAPEQADDPRRADIRADIYSLGCTFYDLLTGQPPFPEGTMISKVMAHLDQTPRSLHEFRNDVPPELAELIGRMMAKKPAERYQTPIEVARDLSVFVKEALAGKSSRKNTGETRKATARPGETTSGVRLTAAAPTAARPAAGQTNAKGPTGKKTLRRKKAARRWLWIGVGSGLFLILLIVLVIAATSSKSGPTRSKQTAELRPIEPPPVPPRVPNESHAQIPNESAGRAGTFGQPRADALKASAHPDTVAKPSGKVKIEGAAGRAYFFKSDNAVVSGPTSDREITLNPGTYEIELAENLATLRPVPRRFTLAPGGLQTVVFREVRFTWPPEKFQQGKIDAPNLDGCTRLVDDDFRSRKVMIQGRDKGVTWGYVNGNYRIYFPTNFQGLRTHNYPTDPLNDYACEVVARIATPLSTGQWSLCMGSAQRKRGIEIALGTRNQVAILPTTLQGLEPLGKGFVCLRPWVNAGDKPNTLLAILRNRLLEVYVNGVAVCDPVTLDQDCTPAHIYLRTRSDLDGITVDFQRIRVLNASRLPFPDARGATVH